jgi:hypothetical protein
MVPKLFEILFILALTAPVVAVVLGIALLFVPARIQGVASGREHRVPGHA